MLASASRDRGLSLPHSQRWLHIRPKGVRFGADEAGISFAKHSCKPPFSLGLQSFLELLLHKIGVPRVRHSVHETDALSQEQLDKTIVHGMHAVRGADLNQSRYLRKP